MIQLSDGMDLFSDLIFKPHLVRPRFSLAHLAQNAIDVTQAERTSIGRTAAPLTWISAKLATAILRFLFKSAGTAPRT